MFNQTPAFSPAAARVQERGQFESNRSLFNRLPYAPRAENPRALCLPKGATPHAKYFIEVYLACPAAVSLASRSVGRPVGENQLTPR